MEECVQKFAAFLSQEEDKIGFIHIKTNKTNQTSGSQTRETSRRSSTTQHVESLRLSFSFSFFFTEGSTALVDEI